ncbi:hypothetical protein M2132_000978 [Dysgonomonas sp. PH5-45]|uniref:hypothetical protein n=1 Tax=unclassified Dysgonomonas TaxID=2630389 RepID=UPI002473ECDC|nr:MULTISPECIES: hypothetical protein [unclassified Dysgonomonas]MDH6354650.1 hypothetical protein [Dysgonomonas sp. PH5-45]MDH6387547.1 hypothetical protein [Dysgonomonas sp. PH5-37]
MIVFSLATREEAAVFLASNAKLNTIMKTKNVTDNNLVINANEIITEQTVNLLKKTLGTPEGYLLHMKVLKLARSMVFAQIEKNGWDDNPDNELAPLFKTLNLLYGAFHDIRIERRCEDIMMRKQNEVITIKI